MIINLFFLLFSPQNNTFNLSLTSLRFLLINQLIFLDKFNSHKLPRIFYYYFKFSETFWQISEKRTLLLNKNKN